MRPASRDNILWPIQTLVQNLKKEQKNKSRQQVVRKRRLMEQERRPRKSMKKNERSLIRRHQLHAGENLNHIKARRQCAKKTLTRRQQRFIGARGKISGGPRRKRESRKCFHRARLVEFLKSSNKFIPYFSVNIANKKLHRQQIEDFSNIWGKSARGLQRSATSVNM